MKKGNKSFELASTVEDGMPPLYGDLEKLIQVMLNLLNNAIDAIPEGGTVMVRARKGTVGEADLVQPGEKTRREDDHSGAFFHLQRRTNTVSPGKLAPFLTPGDDLLLIEISDSGCGMSEEIQKSIFTPFFTTKREKGNGLGLSIVLNIVKRHFGAITLQSGERQGTTFTLKFPAHDKVILFERRM